MPFPTHMDINTRHQTYFSFPIVVLVDVKRGLKVAFGVGRVHELPLCGLDQSARQIRHNGLVFFVLGSMPITPFHDGVNVFLCRWQFTDMNESMDFYILAQMRLGMD